MFKLIDFKKNLLLLIFLITASLVGCNLADKASSNSKPVSLKVAAASSLTKPFTKIASLFEARTSNKVLLNFASSGQLADQIKNGAEVDVFASANVKYIDDLIDAKAVLPSSKRYYAIGKLVVWTKKNSSVKVHRLNDLLKPEIKKIAIANPQHAPYGVAAKQALQAVGIWEKIKPKIVQGVNVAYALELAKSGNADAAIVALSINKGTGGHHYLIPDELHKPILQTLAIIKSSKHKNLARRFINLVESQEGQKILKNYGFSLPRRY